MTRLQILIVLGAVGWMALVAIVLAWLRAAAIGSERVDQTWADHYRDNKEPEET